MKCRVCGKEYFCCTDSRKYGAWKSMACSPECYKEYMRRIEESRKPKEEKVIETKSTKKKKQKVEVVKETTTDIECEAIVED